MWYISQDNASVSSWKTTINTLRFHLISIYSEYKSRNTDKYGLDWNRYHELFCSDIAQINYSGNNRPSSVLLSQDRKTEKLAIIHLHITNCQIYNMQISKDEST